MPASPPTMTAPPCPAARRAGPHRGRPTPRPARQNPCSRRPRPRPPNDTRRHFNSTVSRSRPRRPAAEPFSDRFPPPRDGPASSTVHDTAASVSRPLSGRCGWRLRAAVALCRKDEGMPVGSAQRPQRRPDEASLLGRDGCRLRRWSDFRPGERSQVPVGDRRVAAAACHQVAAHPVKPGRHVVRGAAGVHLRREAHERLVRQVLGGGRIPGHDGQTAGQTGGVGGVGRLDGLVDWCHDRGTPLRARPGWPAWGPRSG